MRWIVPLEDPLGNGLDRDAGRHALLETADEVLDDVHHDVDLVERHDLGHRRARREPLPHLGVLRHDPAREGRADRVARLLVLEPAYLGVESLELGARLRDLLLARSRPRRASKAALAASRSSSDARTASRASRSSSSLIVFSSYSFFVASSFHSLSARSAFSSSTRARACCDLLGTRAVHELGEPLRAEVALGLAPPRCAGRGSRSAGARGARPPRPGPPRGTRYVDDGPGELAADEAAARRLHGARERASAGDRLLRRPPRPRPAREAWPAASRRRAGPPGPRPGRGTRSAGGRRSSRRRIAWGSSAARNGSNPGL